MKRCSKLILLVSFTAIISAQTVPYWDMPIPYDKGLPKLLNPQDYVLNPFHQPNEIYDQYTCHGGGDGNNDGVVDLTDKNLADAGTDAFALDVNGDGAVNTDDGDIIQQYIDGTITILPSWWNFLNKDEKLDWFTKMANIYTVDQKQYIEGDESTRYISGNFATEFALRMQGYDENILDLHNFPRNTIPDKFSDSFELNGRANIPVRFVARARYDSTGGILGSHGMNALLIGDNPLDFNDWVWYEPQSNEIFTQTNFGTIFSIHNIYSFSFQINIIKFENIGGSSWGEDMASPYLGGYGNNQNTMTTVVFEIDNNVIITNRWYNPYLLTKKPTVAITYESSIPDKFYLKSVYPNPTNAEATITYYIPYATSANITIFDLLGKKVRTLINEQKIEGNHLLQWDGADSDGSSVSGGIYFIRFQANDFSQTKKLLLLK